MPRETPGRYICMINAYIELSKVRYCRDKAKVIFLYKIIHKLVDITPPASYLRPISWDTNDCPLKYIKLLTGIDAYKYSLYPSVI